MASPVDIGTLITRDPQLHEGRPCVDGTGTSVLAVVELYEQGLSPDEIVAQLPSLMPEGVFAALAYAHANADEIAGYFEEDAAAHGSWLADRS